MGRRDDVDAGPEWGPSHARALMRSRRFATFVVLPLALAASAVAQVSSPAAAARGSSCGSGGSWSVKVGTDAQATEVNLTPTAVTVAQLAALPLPARIKHRVSPAEFTVYTITATVTKIYKEHDRDLHLAIRDRSGHRMITELPDTACVSKSSPFFPGIRNANSQLASWRRHLPATVRITGIGFFDTFSGQSEQAHNQIELHPILDLSFDPPAPGPLKSTPPRGPMPWIVPNPAP
jgi:hypothetical protein